MTDKGPPPRAVNMISTALLSQIAPERSKLQIREQFLEEYVRTLACIDVDPLDINRFDGELRSALFGPATAAWMSYDAASMGRTPAQLKDGRDEIALLINCGPVVQVGSDGDLIQTGEAMFRDYTVSGRAICPQGGQLLSLVLPRKLFLTLAPNIEDLTHKRLNCDPNALSLIRGYLTTLLNLDSLPPIQPHVIGSHLVELAATAANSASQPKEPEGLGLAHARFIAIVQSISRQLTDPRLSLTNLANQHKLSERSVQVILAKHGLSFATFVSDSRLQLARDLLRNPAYRNKSISEIAYACGFNDISHFNRSFRRKFNVTPREVRRSFY